MIKIIGFDLGGVYLSDCWGKEVMQKISKKYNIPLKKLKTVNDNFVLKLSRGEISEKDFLKKFIKDSDIINGVNELILKENKIIYPELKNIFLKLKNNYELAMMNNESTEWNEYRIKKFKLKKYFKYILSSCILKKSKPDEFYYKQALYAMNISPNELLFIDNTLDNVLGAKKCGIQTIYFKNPKQLKTELRKFQIIVN